MAKRSVPTTIADSPPSMQQPDYETWGAKDLWTLSQAAALLMGWRPVDDSAIPPGPDRERFGVIRDKLRHDTGKTTTRFHYTPEDGDLYYPWVVIEWAESSGVMVPPPLKEAVLQAWPSRFRTGAHLAERDRLKRKIEELEIELQSEKHSAEPAYMRDGLWFARELHAAVQAWTAWVENEPHRGVKTPKQWLERWLRQTYNPPLPREARLTDSAIERVAMVANSRKQGGAPSTSKKT